MLKNTSCEFGAALFDAMAEPPVKKPKLEHAWVYRILHEVDVGDDMKNKVATTFAGKKCTAFEHCFT